MANAYDWTQLAAYARSVEQEKPQTRPQVPEDVSQFLKSYTGNFEFLLSVRNALQKWGRLTERQIDSVRKCIARQQEWNKRAEEEAKIVAERAALAQGAPVPGGDYGQSGFDSRRSAPSLDLSKLPAGRYAVPGGNTRLKVQVSKPVSGSWKGFIFVSDGAAYGSARRYGKQAPGKGYEGMIRDELRTIAADPEAASAAYGKLTGHCGVCGRVLENEESVARGIGPICAGRMGW